MSSNITKGSSFNIRLALVDYVFKKDDQFSISLLFSNGQKESFKSIKPGNEKTHDFKFSDSSLTFSLDFVIQRVDNFEVLSQGLIVFKYDDINEKIEILSKTKKEEKIITKLVEKHNHGTDIYFYVDINKPDYLVKTLI
ncbi:hypothetical protein [Arsenophonus nasoniae]|uniref:Uncharacterized protein n=1 Tax=Arsenophonus nasoniae TaxID=638 RepID=A0AA95K880_9GAMM|nr:hypothetical protein [Arsenophonus nasoniae]WGM04085.1 hypothetical protein QE210_21750 [Arsenophonus nasoniae]